MLNFCPLTGWWFLLLCPQNPLQLNRNFHSIPSTTGFHTFPCTDTLIPPTGRCEVQASHDRWHPFPFSQRKNILWDWPWDLVQAFLSPAEGATAGWKTAKWAQGAAESFLGAVPLPSLLLGLKVGRKKGKSYLGSLIPPSKMAATAMVLQYHQEKSILLVACSLPAQASKAVTYVYLFYQ